MPKDYRIKITIRNERLLSAIESLGYKSVRKFCEAFNLGYMHVSNIVSGKIKPINKKGYIIPSVEKILEIVGLTVEEAFTPRQLQGFKKNTFILSIQEKQIASLMNPVRNNEFKLIESDVKTALEDSMKSLTPREEQVLKHRYGINTQIKTLDEIGKLIGGVSRERVRQIEAKGLRKLRHPSRSIKILQAGVKDVYTKLNISAKALQRAEFWGQTKEEKIN
tara:strand:- start:25 stop:687 length:663 start_codon:yes stop_codon:yes gene_type:complete